MNGVRASGDEIDERQRLLPPVTELAITNLALIVAGGIYMASQIDRSATLVPPTVLAAAGGAVLLINIILLARTRDFAWNKFFLVGGWAFSAYVVIAGMIEYVFIYDHVPSKQLALFTVMLAMFALNVPLLLGFSVARYQPVNRSEEPPTRGAATL